MARTFTLEERVAFLTALWRNLANHEYPYTVENYDCFVLAGNRLARILPHVCAFSEKLGALDFYKGADEPSVIDERSVHLALATLLIPEDAGVYVIHWIPRADEAKVIATIDGYATGNPPRRSIYDDLDRRLEDFGTVFSQLPADELAVTDIETYREDILLVMLFFQAYQLGMHEARYDPEKESFDPSEMAALIRRLIGEMDLEKLDETGLTSLRTHQHKLEYPWQFLLKARKDGLLDTVIPASL